jgi:hypothetical protein
MKHIWLLLILAACTALPPSPGMAGLLIPKEQMPKWAAQPENFQLSINEADLKSKIEITVGPADYSWGTAYVLNDYRIWEKIPIDPVLTKDPIAQQWVKGTAKFTLSLTPGKFTSGKTYYVIGYWCNKGNPWQCNGNKWMLTSFRIKPAPVQDHEVKKEITSIQQEIEQIEKELNEIENEESLLDELS